MFEILLFQLQAACRQHARTLAVSRQKHAVTREIPPDTWFQPISGKVAFQLFLVPWVKYTMTIYTWNLQLLRHYYNIHATDLQDCK